jgi:hypothetical protein
MKKKSKRKYQVGGQPATPDDKSAFDWSKSYLASDKYKQRLGNFYQHPDLVQSSRLNHLSGTTFSNTATGYSSSYGHGDMTMANDEFSPSTVAGLRDQYKNPKLTLNRGATVAHELGHASNADNNDSASLRLNPGEQSYIFNRNKNVTPDYRNGVYSTINQNKKQNYTDPSNIYNDIVGAQKRAGEHDADPSENLSDVQAVRYLANKYKLYDARTQDLTPEVLQKLKSDPRIQNELHGSRLFQNFDDKALLDIFNNVASNNKKDTSGFAQMGGDLQYQDNGQDLPTLQNPATKYFIPQVGQPQTNPQNQKTANSFWKTTTDIAHGAEGALDIATYVGQGVSNAKAERDYNRQYQQSLRGKPQYNSNEKGLDNIPIISKNGGEMNAFDYPYKKGKKYYQTGGLNPNGKYRVISDGMGGEVIYPMGKQKKQKGGSVDYAFIKDQTSYPNWVRPNGNMDIWGFEQGGINYPRADGVGSFFPPQYFMNGGPTDYEQAVGLDGLYANGGYISPGRRPGLSAIDDYNFSDGLDGLYQKGGKVSSSKAKEILRDGTAQGHPLTPAQKRYFGWIAGGGKPKAQHGGIPWPDVSTPNPRQPYGWGPRGWIAESSGNDGIFMDGGPIDYNQATGLDSIYANGGWPNNGWIDFNQATGLDSIFCLGGETDFDQSAGLDGLFMNGGWTDYEQSVGLDGIFRKGGIHIKKENRGKFNELKKRTGKTTEELTHSSNPLTRKRANFAKNARTWKHQYGGGAGNYVPNQPYPAYERLIQAHQNGGYNIGDEVDLTPDQIEHLQSQGYDFQLMDNPYSIR